MITVEGLSKRFTQRRGKQVEVIAAVSDVHFTAQDARITGLPPTAPARPPACASSLG